MISLGLDAAGMDLHQAFVRSVSPPNLDEERAFPEAIERLLADRGQTAGAVTVESDAYPLLRNLLTVCEPGKLPPRVEACPDPR